MRKLVLLLMAAMLAGCSSSNPPAEKKPETTQPTASAPQLETGRSAFYEMIRRARTWAPDAKPFRLQSSATKDGPGTDGKAIVWSAWFASPSKGSVKPYTWSGGKGEGLPEKGVSFGPEDTFSPTNRSTQPFDLEYLKTDSDQAYKTAQEHGGEALEKKSPGTQIFYTLDFDPGAHELIWHVAYGDSPNDYKLKLAVNASTGGYLRKEK